MRAEGGGLSTRTPKIAQTVKSRRASPRSVAAMMTDRKSTWEAYVRMWKPSDAAEKRALAEGVLADGCVYTDPVTQTTGLDELVAYMLSFNEQFPGCCFETTYFLEHHDRSIVRWNMVDAEGNVVFDGMSYGAYDSSGSLQAMTGFYEMPATA